MALVSPAPAIPAHSAALHGRGGRGVPRELRYYYHVQYLSNNIRTETRNFPFSVLDFWDKYPMARSGTMAFHRDFCDYQAPSLQAENWLFHVSDLVLAFKVQPRL